MNIIDWGKLRLYILIAITLMTIYISIIVLNMDYVINFMNNLFNSNYNLRSRAFGAFVFFPFLIIASTTISLLMHFEGKIKTFKFLPSKIEFQAKKNIVVYKNEVDKIIIIEKDKKGLEIELITKENRYSIYNFEEIFTSDIKDYFQLNKEFAIKFYYKTKSLKTTYKTNKNIS